MTPYLARFASGLSELLILADSADEALAIVELLNIEEAPAELRELPRGVFACQVRWPDDLEGEDSPADFSEAGVVLEPFGALANWLEVIADAELGVPSAPPLALVPPPPPTADGELEGDP